jgi:hypothetical protein
MTCLRTITELVSLEQIITSVVAIGSSDGVEKWNRRKAGKQ